MNRRRYFVVIIHIFRIFDQILSILLKYAKFVNGSGIEVLFKDRGGLLNYSIRFYVVKIYARLLKTPTFRQKWDQKCFLAHFL